MIESISGWIFLGIIAGALASWTAKKPRQPIALDIAVGIIGALIGGWIFKLLGIGLADFTIYSLLIAFASAIALLGVWHLIGLSIGVLGLAAGIVAVVLVVLHLDGSRKQNQPAGVRLTFRDRCMQARLRVLHGIAEDAERLYDQRKI